MRFLLFNVVVAVALVFLFAGDKADIHAAADRAHDAATDMKAKAFEVIGAQNAPKATPQPSKPVEQKTAAATPPEKTPTTAERTPKPQPGTAAAEAVKEVQVATRKLVPPLPPEVEKRRAEVLAEGIVGGKVSGKTDSGTSKFMTASDRKRDLMLLSEEMELFSARSISR
jgi:outer membrane biosynthesis protein TonB